MSPDGIYQISFHNKDISLKCIRIQSRHTSPKTYFLWISYNAGEGAQNITG